VNYDTLPVNRAQCPVHTYNKDGAMRFDGNGGPTVNYEPNSFGGPTQDKKYVERPKPVSGTVARHDHRSDGDYYTQPGNLFRLMPADAKARLISNIVGSMKGIPQRFRNCRSSISTRPIRLMAPAWRKGWAWMWKQSWAGRRCRRIEGASRRQPAVDR
jgi:catalase